MGPETITEEDTTAYIVDFLVLYITFSPRA